jgi:flagellar basal body-associated protein FliL
VNAPYPPQPAQPGYPMQPPPKKSNTLKIVLIVAGSVLALCCAGGIAFAVLGGKAVDKAVKEAPSPV